MAPKGRSTPTGQDLSRGRMATGGNEPWDGWRCDRTGRAKPPLRATQGGDEASSASIRNTHTQWPTSRTLGRCSVDYAPLREALVRSERSRATRCKLIFNRLLPPWRAAPPRLYEHTSVGTPSTLQKRPQAQCPIGSSWRRRGIWRTND